LIIDDVISAGTSVRESILAIQAAGAKVAGVAIALDRQERGLGELSAVQEVQKNYGVPCVAIAALDDLVAYLEAHGSADFDLPAIHRYRDQYGV
jgi:orotate phosphoribosyltransferase